MRRNVGRLERSFLVVLALATSAAIACAAAAQRARPPSHAEVRAALARCGERLPREGVLPSLDDEELDPEIGVARIGARWLLSETWLGNGSDGGDSGTVWLFDPVSCAVTEHEWEAEHGEFLTSARVDVQSGPAPTSEERRALVAADPARPDAPEHAMARAWLQHGCPDSPRALVSAWEAIGPIAPAQPWHPALPRRAPATYWTSEQLEAIGAHERTDPPDRIVPSIGSSRRVYAGQHYEIWAASLPGRVAAQALSIVDRTGRRHRWVLLTRGCVDGVTRWVASGEDLAVAALRNGHPDDPRNVVLVIDLREGRAWTLAVGGELDDVRASRAGEGVRLESGGRSENVSFAAIAERIRALSRDQGASQSPIAQSQNRCGYERRSAQLVKSVPASSSIETIRSVASST